MMKRVIITGAKGGTGRSIVRVLQAHGYDAVGIDLKPRELGDNNYVQADLTSDRGLHDILAGAWGVVHFGSVPTDAWTSRSEAYRNLMLGGFNVFQACANLGISRIAYASSIMVYGDFQKHSYLPVTEDSPLSPVGIYSSSKVMLEQLARDMCQWHGMSIAAFRLGRIVYEGSVNERLMPYTKNGKAAADVLWSYVDARDVASACQLWLESEVHGFHAFNIAADNVCLQTPTRELLREFYPQVHDVRAPLEAHESPFSCAALRTALNWSARHDWRALCSAAPAAV